MGRCEENLHTYRSLKHHFSNWAQKCVPLYLPPKFLLYEFKSGVDNFGEMRAQLQFCKRGAECKHNCSFFVSLVHMLVIIWIVTNTVISLSLFKALKIWPLSSVTAISSVTSQNFEVYFRIRLFNWILYLMFQKINVENKDKPRKKSVFSFLTFSPALR